MNKIHVGVITDSHGVTWTAPYDCYLITVGLYPITHYDDGIASWDTDFKINGKQITTNMFTGVDGGHGLYFFPNIKKGDVIYINTKLQQWNIVASTIELS